MKFSRPNKQEPGVDAEKPPKNGGRDDSVARLPRHERKEQSRLCFPEKTGRGMKYKRAQEEAHKLRKSSCAKIIPSVVQQNRGNKIDRPQLHIDRRPEDSGQEHSLRDGPLRA